MDPDATLAIIVDDSETRENRLDAIADLTAWLQSDGYIPARLMNRVRTMERYGNRTSCVIWLDGFATALKPDRDITHGEMREVSYAPGDELLIGGTVARVDGQSSPINPDYPWVIRLALRDGRVRIMGVRTQPRILGDLRMHASTDGYAIPLVDGAKAAAGPS